ncbi:hypothetical protein SAMN05660971_03683 [Halomonas cupida]|uniref:Uncharacterized protein n=1 Tax=Halomonas cupida TaxID=44933 RepID=A0A1M7L0E4_9GAMM|nr:hypothetical protein SAMN05660971_03683 [Halomonas cupida]
MLGEWRHRDVPSGRRETAPHQQILCICASVVRTTIKSIRMSHLIAMLIVEDGCRSTVLANEHCRIISCLPYFYLYGFLLEYSNFLFCVICMASGCGTIRGLIESQNGHS